MDRHGVGRLLAPAMLLALLAGLAGCGGDDTTPGADDPAAAESTTSTPSESATTSESTAPADSPACDEVWTKGAKLPRGYRGCTDKTGTYVKRDTLGCSSGQRMVTYADRFYGVLGGTVRVADGSLDDDRDYRDAVRSCRA